VPLLVVIIALAAAGCGRIAFDARGDGGDGNGSSDGRTADANPGLIEIDAESGTVVAPFRIEEDGTSGVFYVIDGNSRGLTGPTGSAGYTITIQRDGAYFVWSRTRPLDSADDSFFISLDGGPAVDFITGDCGYSTGWHWGAWRSSMACPSLGGRISINYVIGDHTIDFTSREGESMIDRFILVDDPTYVPTD
jgi:hypothetical protein